MDRTGERLGVRFEAGPNALSLLRLGLALEVLLWHAYALPGSTWLPAHLTSFVADVGVDGFFAISGFLICRSWARSPDLGRFVAARARRLFPGLWVCLLVTAFVMAPAAAYLGSASAPTIAEQLRFALGNASVWVHTYDVGVGMGNGSLWSLQYEALCYLVVAGCGLARVGGRHRVLLVIAALWLLNLGYAVYAAPSDTAGLLPCTSRTGLMFACGAALYLYRDLVPLRPRFAAAAALLVAAGAVLLPDYRIVAAPALAYLLVYAGLELGRFRRLCLKTDLSYGIYLYGVPVQHALIAAGAGGAAAAALPGFFALSVLGVLPLAAASWRYVERPALARSRRPRPELSDAHVARTT